MRGVSLSDSDFPPFAPAFIVGLKAEARLIGTHGAVGIGIAAASHLAARGAAALISFGLAGGLDPALSPGAIVIPRVILGAEGERFSADPQWITALGGATAEAMLDSPHIVARAAEKARLFATTNAAALDMESGAVARAARAAGLPFAVLRAVCDPAAHDLPPAALTALDQRGAIGLARVIASVVARPAQIASLLTLARDAAVARRALRQALARIAWPQVAWPPAGASTPR